MWRWLMAMVVILAGAASAAGQTTRPVPPAWNRVVADFAAAVTAGDEHTARSLLSPQGQILSFTPGDNGQLGRLIELAGSGIQFSSRAYVYPPLTLATDLSADAAGAPRIPADAKRAFSVNGPNADRASDTAVKWLGATLAADDGSLLGVIALWNAPKDATAAGHPTFILIKGESDGGRFVIVRVVYGDPIQ